MSNHRPIDNVTADAVTVRDPHLAPITVPCALTPRTHRLTKDSQRALIATGFLIHIAETWAVDRQLIRDVMRYVATRMMAHAAGEEA